MLVLLIGPPGSGKSTFIRGVRRLMGSDLVVVSPDDIRDELFGVLMNGGRKVHKFSREDQRRVFDEAFRRAEGALRKGKVVVVDATNVKPEWRRGWLDIAKRMKAQVGYVLFDVDIGELKRRIAKRVKEGGLHVPDDVLERMVDWFKKDKREDLKRVGAVKLSRKPAQFVKQIEWRKWV